MNYTDEQNKGNNSGMYGQTEGMRSEQENRSDSDRMKAGEQNRQDEVGYDKTRGDETAWKSGEGLSDKVERKLEKAEKKSQIFILPDGKKKNVKRLSEPSPATERSESRERQIQVEKTQTVLPKADSVVSTQESV